MSCGWGVGADLVGWICGLKNMILMTYRQPDFLRALLQLIADWNRSRMAALFTLPVDLFVKRAWYENCDFWTPASWKQFILPILSEDVRLAHQAGVKFGYILTSKAMPLIDMILEAGVDVLIGVDPREYDLEKLAAKTRGRLCPVGWGQRSPDGRDRQSAGCREGSHTSHADTWRRREGSSCRRWITYANIHQKLRGTFRL